MFSFGSKSPLASLGATLSAGTTYYVEIDETGGYSGDFILNITSQ